MGVHRALFGVALAISASAASIAACNVQPSGVTPAETSRATIGPAGGRLAGKSIVLDVPEGALDAPVDLSVESGAAAPAGRTAIATWRFLPSGVVFKKPVVVNIELPGGESGTLWWSKQGDEATFEPRAMIVAGKGRGVIRHFSTGTVDPKSCEEEGDAGGPTCSCRAGDEQGDLLCKTQPDGVDKPCEGDVDAFTGTTGGGCSGYGRRDELGTRCYCKTADGNYLCPQPFKLSPQECALPEGIGSYYDKKNGDGCSGSYVDTNPNTGNSENKSGSGSIVDCEPRIKETKWDSVSGTLECAEPAGGDGGAKKSAFDLRLGILGTVALGDDKCIEFEEKRIDAVDICLDGAGKERCSTAKHYPCAGTHTHGICKGLANRQSGCVITTKQAVRCDGAAMTSPPPCGAKSTVGCGDGGPQTTDLDL